MRSEGIELAAVAVAFVVVDDDIDDEDVDEVVETGGRLDEATPDAEEDGVLRGRMVISVTSESMRFFSSFSSFTSADLGATLISGESTRILSRFLSKKIGSRYSKKRRKHQTKFTHNQI